MRKSSEVAIPSGSNRAGTIELLDAGIASSDSPFAEPQRRRSRPTGGEP